MRIFLAEKGIQVPSQEVDLFAREHREPEFLAKNPMGAVPVLELDDGGYLAESVAICRYFEAQKPDPPLMGTDARDRAFVEMWNRRMEYQIFGAIAGAFDHTSPIAKPFLTQIPKYGQACRNDAIARLEWLDKELASRPFIAGARYTIADITALCTIDLGRMVDLQVRPAQKNLARWYEAVSSRPSAKA